MQIGPEGVLVVNPGAEALADAVLAEIARLAPGQRVRVIVATDDDPAHIGGNAKLASGPTPRAQRPAVIAHENASLRIRIATISLKRASRLGATRTCDRSSSTGRPGTAWT